MVRLAAIFTAICIVVISASLGAVLYLYFGVRAPNAAIIAITVLAALVLLNAVTTRLHDRRDVGDQIADLSRGTTDLARQVGELGRRLVALETRVDTVIDRARAATDPLAVEIGELGTLVKQLAESVALHDTALARAAEAPPSPPPAPPPESMPTPVETMPAAAVAAPEPPPAPPPRSEVAATAAEDTADTAMAALIEGAVRDGRIDLYLQPIVTLPQRKVRFYEALSRLRKPQGEILPAADYLAAAENAGLMPTIDNLLLFRCVQVLRRLMLKNREIGLFCNVSAATLTDAIVFPQFLEFIEANRALASSLVFEFKQSAFRTMGPIEQESLAALAERGFHFSLDNLADLRIEPRDLADRGFRFVKISAALLLNRSAAAATDIHPADLSDLLGRFGIDLIADRIESEAAVVDLLDYDVRYGQGFLFSPPRPVRQEALHGGGERLPILGRDGEEAPVKNGAAMRPPAATGAAAALDPAEDLHAPSPQRASGGLGR
jgi:cyclic-di-GMP phosphodiesterase TipF (flagellum assembly factor)